MIKKFLFFLSMAALFLISCSDSEKFDNNSKNKIKFDIFYESFLNYKNKPYIYVYASISPRGGEEEYYYYYWVLDGEKQCYNCHGEQRCYNCRDMEKGVSYGDHVLEFVLIDIYGDTLSESGVIRIDEPLKVTLLSPIEGYKMAKNDTIKFQYKISGIDKWEEEPQIMVYVSKDEEVWENGQYIQNNFLAPPQTEQVYYWGVKAFTGQDTAFSEIRSVWIKN